ncbi:oxidoreductase HTATIP2 [Folsomia candida]|uniref:Oxidoreductase HTATIP2 n=1 Tax=Folsomia candida TaxID=158441 RepID=A0A226F236_FOLCA|nr:oxidoreductase HTATIP2 [Folsomia candida]OXA63832.1 Oxidoreductase HTATIP2 [Folsomia candida]
MALKTAVVLGGSGAVGSGIVKALANCPQYEQVTLLGRSRIELPETENYAKFTQTTMDFENIPSQGALFAGFSAAFYAIGVSQTKVDEETYRKIELTNALAIATLMKEVSIPDIHWVTGQGTSKNSLFLFARVKAEVEETIGKMGFRRVIMYRPAGILADKSSSMGPKATSVFRAIDRFHVMSVESELLGEVMVGNSLKEMEGEDNEMKILENCAINKIGKDLKKP